MSQPELFELVVLENRAYVMRRADCRLLGGLTRLEAIALKLIAEGLPTQEAEKVFQDVVPLSASALVQRVDARFSPLLKQGRGVATSVSFEKLASVSAPDSKVTLRELPGPRVLHWHVTRYCPRKCVYCYAEPLHGGRAEDAIISRVELARIFAEAAVLGAEHLVVAGSEPMLRPDLPEVMGDAIAHGITPFLTTKHPINQDLALRLAKAGVNHVSLSVDTISPGQSLMMIGSATYPLQIRSTIAHLSDAGVEFSIQSVATEFNVNDICGVARMASDLGAKVMQVVPFETVRKPITRYDNFSMSLRSLDVVRKTVEELANQYPSVRFELFEKLGTGTRAQFHCDIGMTKLFFLPDGIVHRCYKLVDDLMLTGRDLKHCTVADAWHDPCFGLKISPPRDLYQGSACSKCGRFDNCHSEGRCIYEASVTHKSYYAQDRSCNGPYSHDSGQQLVPVEAIRTLT
jgi:MoaA/NifB/PqqE/SkfB family radical SAM enzyme